MAKESTPNFEWQVHIQEGKVYTVYSPNPEGALMQGFAKYWEENPQASLLVFDINLVNVTLAKAYESQQKILGAEKEKKPHAV